MTTWFHWISHKLELNSKGGKRVLILEKHTEREKTEEESAGQLTRGGKGMSAGAGSLEDRRRGGEITGDGRNRLRPREPRQRTERKCQASGARGGKIFLKTGYGRTGQSTVPVRCTPDSAQENGVPARGSRCTGHCTVQCPVHTGLSSEPSQRGNFGFLNFSI